MVLLSRCIWFNIITNLVLLLSVETKKNKTEKWGTTYDFIVIGGGTAGSVIAGRLSEMKKWKVLLLEAGEQAPFISKIPSLAQSSQLSTSNWRYFSESEKNTFKGLQNNSILWSSGKGLGGSSIINYMIYERGNPEDYDNWEKMGNSGWSFKDVLPYFLKSEKCNLEYSDASFHNKSGFLSIEYSHSGKNSIAFLEAAKTMGYNVTDYNGKDQIGFSPLQAVLKNGERQTTAQAYLDLSLQNLEVVLLAEVTKILMDSKGKNAKAVKFIKAGRTYRASASKEIIVSAGTFNSPKLLMLSGIGPEDNLKKLKIHPVIDLPVGQALRDHVTYPALNFITNPDENQTATIKNYLVNMATWYMSGKGQFSSLGNFEAVGFVKLSNSTGTRPDVELLFSDSAINSVFRTLTNVQDSIFEKLYPKNQISWSVYPTLLHPESKGRVLLKSKRASDPPLLHSNYFSNKSDMRYMIDAIRFVLNMTETQEFRKMNATLNEHLVPGCEVAKGGSDEYWECAIRTLASTSYDQFGSCKMGPADDIEAVVDNKLKVYGTDNLRVADASVIPVTISGRLFAVTVMIAERTADFIKEIYK